MVQRLTCILMIIPLVLTLAGATTGDEMDKTNYILVDFKDPETRSWMAVNDGVMGGLSRSQLAITGNGTGAFEGSVSLENNGGFASVRMSLGETDLSGFDGLAVHVAGDGKRYRLRLRTDDRFDGIAYQATFETTRDVWETIEIPFDSFVPTYRGRTLSKVAALNTSRICQIGFMIADKQSGRFRLEIARISAYLPQSADDGSPAPD